MHRQDLLKRLSIKGLLLLQDPRIWLFVLAASLISLGAVEDAMKQAQLTPLILP